MNAARTEYALEVYNEYHDRFVEQIDVFETYEEARMYARDHDIPLEDGEYLEITEIEYDEDDEEFNRTGLMV